MIGYRGAFRYTKEPDLLGLELEAVLRVWDSGYRNLHLMFPFVRTPTELARCRDLVSASGLLARQGFELWVNGIDAISVNVDVVDSTRRLIDSAERRVLLDAARASL